ncbi:MAG: cysteine hydrolase [Paenarthrobacter ureafaciens]|uniref:cysteine hydrolase family protein n=1 Tax=Paenarthrobacter ureafaciens TaxID=37931 RepID=UPI001ACFD285|nr:cysteine hydrolase [Paenarthrobacter ureafaciens]MBN9129161.1 cysteine hydrolase [Paenarthrobacter ureafaciens]
MNRLDATKAAIVVVDIQNDFCHGDGYQGLRGKDVARVQSAVTRLEPFIREARELGVPVVFMQNLHDPQSDTEEWRARHLEPRDSQSCLPGTWGAEFFVLEPQTGDHVLAKSRYSSFVNTGLEELLRSLGRTSIFFCGVATSICVETSLRDATCLDFLVTLVDDCCGDYSETAHNNTVRSVVGGFGAVTASKDVLEGFRASAKSTCAAG